MQLILTNYFEQSNQNGVYNLPVIHFIVTLFKKKILLLHCLSVTYLIKMKNNEAIRYT